MSTFYQYIKIVWLGLLLTSGCIRLERVSTAIPATIEGTPISTPLMDTLNYGWVDVNYLMEGVCFEAALSMADEVLIIPDARSLDAFYTQIERSQLCEDSVNRGVYAFNEGDMIVGVWSSGTGCTSRYVVQKVQRDDAQKQEAIQLQFVTEGDCPYELVEPFWIALPQSANYNLQIEVQR